jgi:hypothetical protein
MLDFNGVHNGVVCACLGKICNKMGLALVQNVPVDMAFHIPLASNTRLPVTFQTLSRHIASPGQPASAARPLSLTAAWPIWGQRLECAPPAPGTWVHKHPPPWPIERTAIGRAIQDISCSLIASFDAGLSITGRNAPLHNLQTHVRSPL